MENGDSQVQRKPQHSLSSHVILDIRYFELWNSQCTWSSLWGDSEKKCLENMEGISFVRLSDSLGTSVEAKKYASDWFFQNCLQLVVWLPSFNNDQLLKALHQDLVDLGLAVLYQQIIWGMSSDQKLMVYLGSVGAVFLGRKLWVAPSFALVASALAFCIKVL